MKNVDVLIFYEHVSREYESVLLMKKSLEKRGYTVVISRILWDSNIFIFLYRPKVVIMPWIYDDFDLSFLHNVYGGYKNNSFKIINMHSEQIVCSMNKSYMLPTGSSKGVYHFTWGNYFKDQLMKIGIDNNMIFVTGNQRIDFFKKDFKSIIIDKIDLANKFNLDKNKKWILFIGSFSKEIIKKTGLQHLEKRGFDDTSEYVRIAHESYFSILCWMEYLCNNSSIVNEYEIIYRPHPGEYISDELVNIQRKYKNFSIIKDYSIRDWMAASYLLFGWNTTSAVEAVFANKTVFYLRPQTIPKEYTNELFDLVEIITSKEKLLSLLLSYVDNSLFNKDFKEKLSYYYDVEDSNSFIKISNAVDTIMIRDENYFSFKVNRLNRLKLFIKDCIKSILFSIGLYKIINKDSLTLQYDLLSKREKENYLKRVNSLENLV